MAKIGRLVSISTKSDCWG